MATKGHTRRRSSIDRVIDLLSDLEESQIAVLLDDLNHTTSSNVPVSEAIAMFEQHTGKSKRSSRSCRSPSPMRTLQVELERRHSKRMSARISSAPEPRFRSSFNKQPDTRIQPDTAPQPNLQHQSQPVPQPLGPVAEPPVEHTITTNIDIPGATLRTTFDVPAGPPSPPLTAPLQPTADIATFPTKSEAPPTASIPTSQPAISPTRPPSPPPAPISAPAPRPRSYKRISRPVCLSPTATAELHTLLLAFFNEAPLSTNAATATTPTSATTTISTPSPTTPHFSGLPPPTSLSLSSSPSSGGSNPSPFGFRSMLDGDDVDDDPDRTLLGLDLLEPPPTLFPAAKLPPPVAAATPATAKTPDFVVSRGRGLKPMPSIGSMFEAFRM
ncbi:hypothetical protein VTJ04DRAFT_2737 [Mycothermus thermophilus]|uniref:uncharacterized protein n=1 Tax=Humicola insolens TaxID=85995 RepID=UPI00374483E9